MKIKYCKKLIWALPIVITFSINKSVGQVVDTGGNVGIGVNPPLEKLHINGAIRGNSSGGALRINTPSGYLDLGSMNSEWAHLQTDRANFYFNRSIYVDGTISSYSENNLVLRTSHLTRIRILRTTGFVGIGDISPTAKLHIQQDGNSWSNGIRLSNSTRNWDIVSDNGGERLLIAKDQNTIDGLTLYNSNFGVGTDNPQAKLHAVKGGQSMLLLTGENTSSYSLSVGINDDGVNFTNNSFIRGYSFRNASGNLLAITENGRVGIGTTNPTQKLTVNGTVYSTEVKVDVNAGTGPDYVFEPAYQLPTLTEIENYIKANKHLPEVPSAKEMEANGINLSEMNMLLLKKVEELTLHLIEANKKIEYLTKRIDEKN